MTWRGLRRAGWVFTAALLLALTGAIGATGGVAGAQRSADDERPSDVVAAQVQRVFAEELDDSGVPGGAFAVVSHQQVEARGGQRRR
jgi:hypothetical protein